MAAAGGAQAVSEREPLLDPATYAALVRAASDEDLAAGIAVNGELILSEIFAAMPAQLDQRAVEDVALVAEWRIACPPGGDVARWQVAIAGGTCTVTRDGDRLADLIFTIDAVDFVKLVTGNADGPQLYMFGSLRVEGDLLAAARYPAFFTMGAPGSRS